jgi:hypothetical protein
MQTQRVLMPLLLVAFLVCFAAMPGAADTATMAPGAAPAPAATSAIHGSQLIKVSHCEAKLNVMQSGGFVGYTPGYYGGYYGAYGRGYYGDVYGAAVYQAPVTTTLPQLGIDYVNISHKTMNDIEFGFIANQRLIAEVKDVGTFSPGAEIKHKFEVSPNIFPIQTALPQCVPLRITFADGTKWRNPRLPPKGAHVYDNHPITP